MARKFLVFQHSQWEAPGEFLLRAAEKKNVQLDICRVWEENIPDLLPYDCLVVLGGSPNVDQEEKFPFLTKEKKVILQSLSENRPYLGFCLGHQLLAEAMGAVIGPNFQASIGFITGYVTHHGQEHPVLNGLPCCLPFFKWHSQAVLEPLPRHLQVLLTSAACQVEAISIVGRPHIVGFQFDNPSAFPGDVGQWIEHDKDWLGTVEGFRVDPEKIMADAERYCQEIECEFEMIFDNFLATMDHNR